MRVVLALALICAFSSSADAQNDPAGVAQCVVPANSSFSVRRVAALGPVFGGTEFFPRQDRMTITRPDNSVALVDSGTGVVTELYPPSAAEEPYVFKRSPTGAIALWIDPAGVVTMRDTLTGAVIAQPEVLQGRPRDLRSYARRYPETVFSDDGMRLGVQTLSGSVVLLDGQTGEPIGGPIDRAPEGVLRFSPRGERLVLGMDLAVALDARNGERLYAITDDGPYDLYFSRDGARMIVEGNERWALIDPHAGQRIAEGESEDERAEFIEEGAFVLSRDPDEAGRLIDARSGAVVARFGALAFTSGYVSDFGIQFSPDHRNAVTRAPDGTARLWDLREARVLADLGLYATSSRFNMSEEDWGSFDPAGPPRPTGEFRFSADGARLITHAENGWVTVWDTRTGRMMRRLGQGGERGGLWTSTDGGIVIVLEADRTTVWDTRRARRLASLRQMDRYGLKAIELSPDGDRLVVSDTEAAELWDLRRGRQQARVDLAGGFSDVSISRDGRYAILSEDYEALQLWDLRGGARVALLGPAWWARFYDVGSRTVLLAANGEAASAYDVRDGALVWSCPIVRGRLGTDDVSARADALLVMASIDDQRNTELWRIEPAH